MTAVLTAVLSYYAEPGIMTDPHEHAEMFASLPGDIPALSRIVQGLLMHSHAARLYNVKTRSDRRHEVHLRSIAQILASIKEMDERPLTIARPPHLRFVGNCRTFATMTCAMLRHCGIAARARVGFAAYFDDHRNWDHWVCEYWNASQQRWVLVDAQLDEIQLDDLHIDFDPCDVPRDQFILAGAAWQLCRTKQANPRSFGFFPHCGLPFICGNLLLDLMSLNKVELLPWNRPWDLAEQKTFTTGDLAYLDSIAELMADIDDRFPQLRYIYENDPKIYIPVERYLQDLEDDENEGTWYSDMPRSYTAIDAKEDVGSPPPPKEDVAAVTRQGNELFDVIPGVNARPSRPRSSHPAVERPAGSLEPDKIVVRGAQQHNLKNIDVTIPRYKFVVLTGVSGSGKSSLAFDTIYAEGQRRYVESLSPYVRHFLEKVEKPRVDFIGGLSPAIAIEQKTVSKNPRSTVGTVTEVLHYLRLLYSRVGTAHCLRCGSTIQPLGPSEIAERLAALPAGTSFRLLAPIVRQHKGTHTEVLERCLRDGYQHARINGTPVDLNEPITLAEDRKHTIELLVASPEVPAGTEDVYQAFSTGLVTLVRTALRLGNGMLVVDLGGGNETIASEKRVCSQCGTSFPDMTSQHFSSNSPAGMCLDCNGLGTKLEVDPALIVQDARLSILDGALRWYGNLRKKKTNWPLGQLEGIADHYGVDLKQPWQDLPQSFRDVILYGSGDERIHFTHKNEWDEGSWSGESTRVVKGLIYHINRLFRQTRSDHTRRWYASFMSQQPCSTCGGTRLSAEARAVTLGGKGIHEVGSMALDHVLEWVDSLYDWLSDEQVEIAGEALKETRDRLQFMLNVGLHYLTLDRTAPSLSGGEGQRIRLASQLGCGLVGVLYVLDEPSIGLHARDQRTLLDTLLQLRDMGNTVLVVEHDAETMRSADWLIDLGPGAGILGGEVVAAGPPEVVAAHSGSLTGRYLSGELAVIAPNGWQRRKPASNWLTVVGARMHNLKHIDVRFPLGLMTCITGVSGSGKSSLVNGTLYPALTRALHDTQVTPGPHDYIYGLGQLDKVINITQDPIGRTPRSNPATYAGVFDEIRRVFAATPEAHKRGYGADRFSFNVPGGRCETCKGHGQNMIEMHFLADVWVTCKECKGMRFNHETLTARYKDKNIAEVLDMDVQEALAFFADHSRITRILQTLHAVGLDYIKLGQSATTLSGGEAQRIKLARELSRVATGRTLYILDEPTTGLHFADIQRLLDVLHKLVDAGNTVIVIEHNMDVIKMADWIIDLGPEGGDAGGRVIAQGTPEDVAKAEESYTGRFLRRILKG